MSLRAALYKRVSSQAQVKEGYSLAFQEEIMRDYCARQGLSVVRVYEDGGRTGSNTERAGLQALVGDAKQRAFDVVLIFRVDRFSRDPLDLLYLVQELNRRSITLKSVTEAVDASDPAGELMLTILGAIGKFVRANILQNAILGKRKRAEAGRYTGGALPFGYAATAEGQLVPNDEPWGGGHTAAEIVS
ncbi:MAG: recombinase family protein, partial [Clostridia bacterium]